VVNGRWDEHGGRRTFKGATVSMETLLAATGCALAIWLVHPPVLAWLLRELRIAPLRKRLQVEIGEIHANLSRPIVFERVRVRDIGKSQPPSTPRASSLAGVAMAGPLRDGAILPLAHY
jgi:hypothetical protein